MMPAGRKSKCFSMAARIRAPETCSVPNVSIETEAGLAMPMV